MEQIARLATSGIQTTASIPADETWIINLTWDRLRSGEAINDELLAELLIATWSLVPIWLVGAGLASNVGPVRLFALILSLEYLTAELKKASPQALLADFSQFCWGMRVRLAFAAEDLAWLARRTSHSKPTLGRFYREAIDVITGLEGYLYFCLIPRDSWRRGMLPLPAAETATEELVIDATQKAPARVARRQRRRGPLPRTSPWRILIDHELMELDVPDSETAERVRRLYHWAFHRVPAWFRAAQFHEEYCRQWKSYYRRPAELDDREVELAFRTICRFAKVFVAQGITYLLQPSHGGESHQLVRLLLNEIMPKAFAKLMMDAEWDWLPRRPILYPRQPRAYVHHVIRRGRDFSDHHPEFYGVFFDQLVLWLDDYKKQQAA